MIAVYLDSQDYSILSAFRLEPAQRQIRDRLCEWSRAGVVRFVFSCYIVSEAAPTGSHANEFAIARGELLSQLCGQNALREASLLVTEEVERLASASAQPINALSPTGDFFPELEFDDPQSLDEIALETITDRARRRMAFKNGVLKPQYRSAIQRTLRENYVRMVTARYPMKPEYAETFARYSLGEASKAEASAALRASIRDPRWLMRWFASSPELAEPIVEIVRKPGREIGAKARELIDRRTRFQTDPETRDIKDALWNNSAEMKRDWEARTSSMVEGFAKRVCKEAGYPWPDSATHDAIAKYCPGLNAAVRSTMTAIWDSYGGSRRAQPSDSQFPDSMHAVYAPYVDIFRADRFMAPHVRRQLENATTTVVPVLADLPAAIEQKLADRG